MTDSEKLDLVLSKADSLATGMDSLSTRVDSLSTRVDSLAAGVDSLSTRVDSLSSEMRGVKQRMAGLELHIENGTDKNIQLVAENFVELTKKLNQAIPAADKNLAYEVKVNYLVEEVMKLKTEIAELKNRIA